MRLRRVVLAASASLLAGLALASAASSESGTRELAFVRDGTIYLVRTDGTGLRRLTRGFAPAWSPDGARLAFVRPAGPNGASDLWVANANGRNARRLTRLRGAELSPAWSPDGTRIAFASNLRGRYDLYVMRAGGTGIRRVAGSARGDSHSPAWSPDGRLIAFSSSAWTPENPEIYVVRPDGAGLRRLTRTRGGVEVLGDDGWPRWSPDGRRIVFSSNRTGDGEVWTMAADGRGQRRIAGLPRRDDWAPTFSPDGASIAFHSLRRTRGELYLVSPNGSGVRRLGVAGSEPAFRP